MGLRPHISFGSREYGGGSTNPALGCTVAQQSWRAGGKAISFRAMRSAIVAAMVRIRLLTTKALSRLGFGEHAFLLLLAVLIGIVAAAAAVGFHELIRGIRNVLYANLGPRVGIYSKG